MKTSYHQFIIPVMGTGHSADTPIRVAHFGISSVISLVDDILLEQLRGHYCSEFQLPYTKIANNEEDGRAKRITAFLNTTQEIVDIKTEKIKALPFFENNDKSLYFEMLPDDEPVKNDYKKLLEMPTGPERDKLAEELTDKIMPGAIEVNIMTKLDRLPFGKDGKPLDAIYSDANAALRGYANSKLKKSSMVFSAGMNLTLFEYMTHFKDFYPDENGDIKKKIVLKVSDFRSSLIQGKVLAQKGLPIYEFRIESGLNCGGHAFASNGTLLPSFLKEFKEKRSKLSETFIPILTKYFEEKGQKQPDFLKNYIPLITVQGGIGNSGEQKRLMEYYDVNWTGWGSPFLLVPEAAPIDKPTIDILKKGTKKDYYLSGASPLGIGFNNIHGTGAELWTQARVKNGTPGSPCPKGFLRFNTEFSEKPICTASNEYQTQKIAQINELDISEEEKQSQIKKITQKTCICHLLGNSSLIRLGLMPEDKAPQCICPGPNLAWFNREYSIKEMIDHIYGRIDSLVPAERPHMFSAEVELYVNHFEELTAEAGNDAKELKKLEKFKKNLEKSMEYCLELADEKPFGDENLPSIKAGISVQKERLTKLFESKKAKIS